MNNLSVDRVIECVKIITDNNRCAVCDKSDGNRVRYACGHTACDDCVISTEDCLICLTPPLVSAPAKPDDAFTQRAKNATSLLKACQDLFDTNVFKRQRLSEQLRIERELFPECIQAPMKYDHKKKSLNSSKTKENRRSSFFPGEGVSFIKENKMENTVSYVQQWLNKNEGNLSRMPFADLNVNHQSNKTIAKLKDLKRVDENKPLCVEIKKRKRSHYKTTIKNELPKRRKRMSVHNSDSFPKKSKNEFDESDVIPKYCAMLMKNDNDESGIVIDDEPIVIDDSQKAVNDKDIAAWMAVLEADNHKELKSTSLRSESKGDTNIIDTSLANSYQNTNNVSLKVPFYKKSYLIETCKYCNNENITLSQPKEVKITIESDSFTTIVKVFNVLNTGEKDINDISKKTVPVQTNISEILETNNKSSIKEAVTELDNKCKMHTPEQSKAFDIQHDDLSADVGKIISIKPDIRKKCLVIEESDSDVDNEYSGPIHVTADIHRSCEELESGILAEVVDQEDHCARSRRGPRGLTPTSTDSSEKENYNPNRMKTNRLGNKKKPKK